MIDLGSRPWSRDRPWRQYVEKIQWAINNHQTDGWEDSTKGVDNHQRDGMEGLTEGVMTIEGMVWKDSRKES